MGRMSDIDIDTMVQLDAEADSLCYSNFDRQEYIQANYKRVATEIMKGQADANKSNKPES